MIRSDILKTADALITGDRADAYGNPDAMFEQIGRLWAAYDGHNVSAVDAAIKMALMKIARMQMGATDMDSYVDACGYIALAGEMALNNQEYDRGKE